MRCDMLSCDLVTTSVDGDAAMSKSTYFQRDCPTCGRSLRIRVEYLGKVLGCPHCCGEFEAVDPAVQPARNSSDGLALLRRADELLSSIDVQSRSN